MPFIVEALGPDGLFGVFEDEGNTGYLYLYAPDRGILEHLWIYNRSESEAPEEADVLVAWSDDLCSCGVTIGGKLRGVIHLDTA